MTNIVKLGHMLLTICHA